MFVVNSDIVLKEVGMDPRIARRDWLKLMLGAGGAGLLVRFGAGCGYYSADSGAAFAPWDFPGGETVPEMIAARAALLAANPHNTQPWALRVTTSQIDLHADFSRNLGTMDSLLREMHIGLGCAITNMVIAARASGRTPSVSLLPDMSDASLVARVALVPSAPVDDPLFSSIARRHTNRGRYADAPAAAALSSALESLVTEPGIQLHLFVDNSDMALFRQGTIDATNAIISDADMSRDTNTWYRQSADDILQHRDGITIDCSGNGASTVLLSKVTGRPSDETANSYWLGATRGDQTTGSAFGIVSSPAENTRADQLRVGQVYQAMHLWAVSQGLAMQPLNQMAERQDREQTQGLPPQSTALLAQLMGSTDRRAQMLFRIGYPWDDANPSPRRPIEWVLQ
jgi:hypothetical protein